MSELIATGLPSEQGHWYAQDGSPAYTVTAKSGNDRPTTLRDARKLGLVPSVTTITKLMDRPGLNNWCIDQAIMSALTLPRHEGEFDEEFLARVKTDAKERSKKAAERGTVLHTDIERAIMEGQTFRHKHVEAVLYEMGFHHLSLWDGEAEHSFAHPDGFGGKVDWHSGNMVADFKSKDRIEDGKKLAWDEHCIQLAAYAYGLGIENPRAFNIFVGIEDAKVQIHEWTAEELERGLAMFKCLLMLWKLKNKIAL